MDADKRVIVINYSDWLKNQLAENVRFENEVADILSNQAYWYNNLPKGGSKNERVK